MWKDGSTTKCTARRGIVARFLEDTGGNIGIEFVIWMIVFLPLVGIIIDASLLYQAHADMWKVARDGARRLVTDQSTSPAAVKHRMVSELAEEWSYNFVVNAAITGKYPDEKAIVDIKVDIEGASFFGAFSEIYGNDLVAHVELNRGDF